MTNYKIDKQAQEKLFLGNYFIGQEREDILDLSKKLNESVSIKPNKLAKLMIKYIMSNEKIKEGFIKYIKKVVW